MLRVYDGKFQRLLLALAAVSSCTIQAADVFTGTLKIVHGNVSVKRANQVMAGSPGMRLFTQDIIKTAPEASAGLILHDGTRLSLGPNSSLTVQDFVFDPGAQKMNLLIRVFEGVVAYASGKIAQLSPSSVRVETPVGVIGLRGTEFAVSLGQPPAAHK